MMCVYVCALITFINDFNLCLIFHYYYSTASSTIPEQQQTVTAQKTSSNGSGSKVLQRVISLTTANHNDSNNFTKQTTKPSFIPEKLQFSAYEKFEGEFFTLLINDIRHSPLVNLT